ncbi:MAG: transcription elongation factor GreA [Lachnospiraceae bacterium]|nr:transcription elongation factor GreA [Lachnospiraceae bacterium]
MGERMTEGDIRKIQEEIDYRKLVVRKEAIAAVQEARAHGDLSENFEYHAAKKDKNQNESRIRYLERLIANAQIIEDKAPADVAGMDRTVTLYFEDDDEEETITLVTSIRGNSSKGLISIESPIGKALVGHRVGDRILVQVDERVSYYVVIRAIGMADEDQAIRKY